jgi:hypothetical protein
MRWNSTAKPLGLRIEGLTPEESAQVLKTNELAAASVPLAVGRITRLYVTTFGEPGSTFTSERRSTKIHVGVPRDQPLDSNWPVRTCALDAPEYFRLGPDPSTPQLPAFVEGANNLRGLMTFARAQGEFDEMEMLLPGITDRFYAAVADAYGLDSFLLSADDPDWKFEARLDMRIAIAEELGVEAVSAQPTGSWGGLWAAARTVDQLLPGHRSGVIDAMRPLLEEVRSVPDEQRQLLLYDRVAYLEDHDVDRLQQEDHFDLYVVARVQDPLRPPDAREMRFMLAKAAALGVELDEAFLRTTPAETHLPDSYRMDNWTIPAAEAGPGPLRKATAETAERRVGGLGQLTGPDNGSGIIPGPFRPGFAVGD